MTVQAWLLGKASHPEILRNSESPVWTRRYSAGVGEGDCDTLAIVLEQLEAARMIVGHSVQSGGITSFCDGRVWCIDTGMSGHYGGQPQGLEIRGDTIRVNREARRPPVAPE